MSDMEEMYYDIRKERQARRLRNYNKNIEKYSHENWSQFTDYHWYKEVEGKRIDFWPSTYKYHYDGRYYRGARPRFIQQLIDKDPKQHETQCQETSSTEESQSDQNSKGNGMQS